MKNNKIEVPNKITGFNFAIAVGCNNYDIELNKEYLYKNERVIIRRITVQQQFKIEKKWYQLRKVVTPTTSVFLALEWLNLGYISLSSVDLNKFIQNSGNLSDHVKSLGKVALELTTK